jgi:lipopolysaccharide biosynthesis protein
MTNTKTLRAIGIVLPQYHRIPENDAWWGEGFTEWTNTRKARPLYPGHWQPHTPHPDIGYYDLSTIEGMTQQIALALRYGIAGYCYYHYWFNGQMLLRKPLDLLRAHPELKLPYMLCWANENWTRVWDGGDKHVLAAQHYSAEDDEAHMHFLCAHHFGDKRYIKIDDTPVFVVYRHQHFPDVNATVERWKAIARHHGFPGLYLIAVENNFEHPIDPASVGFNASMKFAPRFDAIKATRQLSTWGKLVASVQGRRAKLKSVYDYGAIVEDDLAQPVAAYKRFPCVCPGWDNSARRKELRRSFVLENSTPQRYRDWLQQAARRFEPYSSEENFVFINAMNEWAEGNHLEPCERWGYQYLEATREVFERYRSVSSGDQVPSNFSPAITSTAASSRLIHTGSK